MRALAKIHVAKKQLGLDDDTYRAVLERVTGKTSSKAMTAGEQLRVVAEFERLGFQPASKTVRKVGAGGVTKLSGPYAGKLQALWIAAWNLGLVDDKRDAALLAFVKRQTGIERTEWLLDAATAKKAVEALKAMCARAGVDWSAAEGSPRHASRHGYQIARAQLALLPEPRGAFWTEVSAVLRRPLISAKPTDAEWIIVMNALGERVRAVKGAA